ncbi:type II toxin-antitoxin system Phd/YefM family antitoxin [Phenylobacterium sp.]|uniref:type II toxin-antitoxin system Phd/YefM family antitoxin n=1 Tax=Phenylobacterium sp. TaxID=1871053 RepID=UPI0037CA17B8
MQLPEGGLAAAGCFGGYSHRHRNSGFSAVLMSLEDFASYEETRYLLRSPANAERLLASVASLEAGEGREHDLAE